MLYKVSRATEECQEEREESEIEIGWRLEER